MPNYNVTIKAALKEGIVSGPGTPGTPASPDSYHITIDKDSLEANGITVAAVDSDPSGQTVNIKEETTVYIKVAVSNATKLAAYIDTLSADLKQFNKPENITQGNVVATTLPKTGTGKAVAVPVWAKGARGGATHSLVMPASDVRISDVLPQEALLPILEVDPEGGSFF
jgi:hypothetical protein